MIDEKIVEAVARAIADHFHKDADFGLDGASAYAARPREFQATARAAITAYQAEIERERAEQLGMKASRDGVDSKLTWIRQYRARTGCPLKEALAAYDADESLPNPPGAP